VAVMREDQYNPTFQKQRCQTPSADIIIIITIIDIIISLVVLPYTPPFTSAVIPTAQASSFRLQFIFYIVSVMFQVCI
jgi:hypothetical protein